MHKLKPSLLTLAIAAAIPSFAIADIMPPEDTPQATEQKTTKTNSIFNESAQASSNGVLEDSSLNVLIRNFYMNRDFRNSSNDNRSPNGKRQSYKEEWSQGFIGTYESGFTQGTIGVGVDAFAMYGFRLDSGKGRTTTGSLPVNSGNRADRDFSKGGAAIKLRASNTVLKYGHQFVDTPVFSTDDSRLLPETAEGVLLTSNEIENLTLNVGHFTSLRAQEQSYRDSLGLERADFAGGTYQFTENLSASLYYSDLKELWTKKYANINYNLPINDDQALNFDFNFYNTKSQGDLKSSSKVDPAYGNKKLNSNIWSLQAAYSVGAHKFTVAHQRATGNGGYKYGTDGGGAIYLANSVQYSDFNHDDERSWQARYDIDMTQFGVPGLSFMTRYIRGSNINEYERNSLKPGGKAHAWEHDMEAKYVVQTGPAKDLSIRVRHGNYRSSGLADDARDLRVIIDYPWDVLGTFKK